MTMILRLTDDTTTLDLNGGVDYAVPYNEWTPAVANRRRSALGGGGPYEDVIEDIPLHVRGSTGETALANLVALKLMLDQAERWERGANVAAVKLQYLPNNSSLANPVEAVVLGQADGAILDLSPQVNDASNYEIPGARLRLRRRGRWLGQEESQTAASFAENANLNSLSFSTTEGPIYMPTSIEIEFDTATGTITDKDTEPFYIILAKQENLVIWTLANAGAFANVSDTANHALGGSVNRYTPPDTSEHVSSLRSVFADDFRARRAYVFVAVRNNSASTNFTIRAIALNQSTNQYTTSAATKSVTIYGGDTAPQILNLGLLTLPVDIYYVGVGVTASAASGTFDINYIAIVAADETSGILSIGAGRTPGPLDDFIYKIEDRELSHPAPLAGLFNNSLIEYGSSNVTTPAPRGPLKLSTVDDDLSLLVLATDEANSYWRWHESGANEVLRTRLTASRRQAYLVPP